MSSTNEFLHYDYKVFVDLFMNSKECTYTFSKYKCSRYMKFYEVRNRVYEDYNIFCSTKM